MVEAVELRNLKIEMANRSEIGSEMNHQSF
ncbi:hypothetical protein LOK49_LG03G00371 [Camellia lanceoleosa]|uniref:Uncharacterized protein n=1 Tax=Camellia lanceoleosa TaxID=1840588 RepID=A0ACC0IGI0_9ERIC|nr:hypothetical protein LOK49_LG03G00371 [Camellia lanceoleosa]